MLRWVFLVQQINGKYEYREKIESTKVCRAPRKIKWYARQPAVLSKVARLRHRLQRNIFVQVNRTIKKPKIVSAGTEENYKKTEFNFTVGLKTLINKTSVDLKFFIA